MKTGDEKLMMRKILRGYTLVEILVVIFVFSILGVLTTRSLALSLKGSRKSEAIIQVRENISYALSVMERHIRNSQGLDCIQSCSGATCSGNKIVFESEYGGTTSFECATVGADTFIASGSAFQTDRLTGSGITIDCTSVFSCTSGVGIPDSVDININAQAANTEGAEGFEVTSSTKIQLRTY